MNQRSLPWRATYDPYQVLVSESMLQQTRMEVVIPYFDRFLKRFPTVGALAQADEPEVLALWSGLGYYRRARDLHLAAQDISSRNGGVPSDLESLMKLPGLGRYTAGAVRSIGFDLPAPIVEGNVTRILSRLLMIEEVAGSAASNSRLWTAAEEIVKNAASPRKLNQGLMDLGALVCRPQNPLCAGCPIETHCGARAEGVVEQFPRIGEKRAVVSLRIPLLIVQRGDQFLVVKIKTGRLMREMYHLPHGSDLLIEMGLGERFREGRSIGTVRHTVTHRRIEFQLHEASLRDDSISDGNGEFSWMTAAQLLASPHPSYVAKALRAVEAARL